MIVELSHRDIGRLLDGETLNLTGVQVRAHETNTAVMKDMADVLVESGKAKARGDAPRANGKPRRWIKAKFESACGNCGGKVRVGERIRYDFDARSVVACDACPDDARARFG